MNFAKDFERAAAMYFAKGPEQDFARRSERDFAGSFAMDFAIEIAIGFEKGLPIDFAMCFETDSGKGAKVKAVSAGAMDLKIPIFVLMLPVDC